MRRPWGSADARAGRGRRARDRLRPHVRRAARTRCSTSAGWRSSARATTDARYAIAAVSGLQRLVLERGARRSCRQRSIALAAIPNDARNARGSRGCGSELASAAVRRRPAACSTSSSAPSAPSRRERRAESLRAAQPRDRHRGVGLAVLLGLIALLSCGGRAGDRRAGRAAAAASRASSARAATARACRSPARPRRRSWRRRSTPPRSAWRRPRRSCGRSATATWPSSTPCSARRRSGWRSSTASCGTCASTRRWRR